MVRNPILQESFRLRSDYFTPALFEMAKVGLNESPFLLPFGNKTRRRYCPHAVSKAMAAFQNVEE